MRCSVNAVVSGWEDRMHSERIVPELGFDPAFTRAGRGERKGLRNESDCLMVGVLQLEIA